MDNRERDLNEIKNACYNLNQKLHCNIKLNDFEWRHNNFHYMDKYFSDNNYINFIIDNDLFDLVLNDILDMIKLNFKSHLNYRSDLNNLLIYFYNSIKDAKEKKNKYKEKYNLM